jgi:hypothetical protein
MSPVLALAIGVVRGWTWLYTAGMRFDARAARRAEIESDLWEFHEDARRRGASPETIALLMLLRLVLGAHDDLCWRVENRTLHVDALQQALWAGAIAAVAMLWLMMSALQTKEPPLSPVDRVQLARMLYPVHMSPAAFSHAPRPPAPFDVVLHVSLARKPPPPPPPPKPDWR